MADSSSPGPGVTQFDLNSQAGVLEVLTSIRNSRLTSDERNELRDLVFLFANGGGDAAVRTTLEERLVALGLTEPVAKEAKEETKAEPANDEPKPVPEKKPEGGFAAARPTPTFAANPRPEPVASAPKATTPPPPPASAPAVPTPPPAAPAPEPAAPTATPAPDMPEPAPAPKPLNPTSVTTDGIQVPKSQMPASAPSSPEYAIPLENRDLLNRIREIKADVNQRVGNPVNLVDIDNKVGREYMNSLLEAMRAVSGGTPQSAQSAIQKLEAAYEKVKTVVGTKGIQGESDAAPAPVVPPTPPEPPKPVRVEVPDTPPVSSVPVARGPQLVPDISEVPATDTQTTPPPSEPPIAPAPAGSAPMTPPSAPNVAAPGVVPPPPAAQTEAVAPAVEQRKPDVIPVSAPNIPKPAAAPITQPEVKEEKESGWARALSSLKLRANQAPEEETRTEPAPQASAPTVTPSAVSAPMTPPAAPAPAVPTPEPQAPAPAPTPTPMSAPQPATPPTTPTPAPANVPVQGVEQAKPITRNEIPLRKPADLPETNSRQTDAPVGEEALFTNDVDNGLNQLLSEWDLFKKSGLIGTGPKGREHPLFKKLAPLQIPLILAGRFEGATQEIKQSVTDYMNGWRYEQGIVYEPGETFEHYLRRVISHILTG